MLKQLLAKVRVGQRAERQQWDAGLVWFRLRYLTPDGPTRSIRLLSRPQACGRVALYFRPDEAVSALYLGIPEPHVRLLGRMAEDFNFSLQPKRPEVIMPAAQPMIAVSELPWERPFVAHVANEFLFASQMDGIGAAEECINRRGSYLPQPSAKVATVAAENKWQLPHHPLPGLTARPYWHNQPPPMHLTRVGPDNRGWLLGRSQSGIPLHVSGKVNIYGDQEAVAEWLVLQATQTIMQHPGNLVILDGAGDLVPRLKRKAVVTRLLGTQLAYLDFDDTTQVAGLNPLAPVPGETELAMLQRWQRWFEGMNVPPQGVQILTQAQANGVGDIPSLRKWVTQVERQGQAIFPASNTVTPLRSLSAVSGLGLVLSHLTANRTLREWLEWPTNRFEILPEGTLLLACKGSSWQHHQILRAVLLAVCHLPSVRLVVHHFPWHIDRALINSLPSRTMVSNGPLLTDTLPIFVQSSATSAHAIGKRFLKEDRLQIETVQLLQSGEALVLTHNGPVYSRW